MKSSNPDIGTFHQYHTALLLLAELYATPERYYEDRIWDCLDYVFELPVAMHRMDKARLIYEEVVEKLQYFQSMRKVRAPKCLEDGLAAVVAWREKMLKAGRPMNGPPPLYQVRPDIRERTSERVGEQIRSGEFSNYALLPETHYYAQQTGRMSHSPPSVEGAPEPMVGQESFQPSSNSNTASNRVDIDWVGELGYTSSYTLLTTIERMG
jgi:hypothetical protein